MAKNRFIKTSRTSTNKLGICIMTLWCVFTVFTLVWIVSASLSTTSEIFDNKILSSGLHFENYVLVLEKYNILKYFFNSLLYTASSCFAVIFLAAPASYAIATYEFRGRRLVQTAYASAMGIPSVMLMVPVYMMVGRMGLSKNLLVLVVIYTFTMVPFTMFFLISFFSTIPKDIQESALVEGCTHSRAFWKVIFPLAQPGIVTVTIFNFIGTWNEYTWALIFANSSDRRTLALGLQAIVDGMRYSGNWAALFAAVVLVFLPTLIMFIFLSEKIMGGVTAGAVKG
ncbi:sugar ABC transporter permease [Anaerofilum sp. An201]|nr:carbohydrate ABC transporter permease [Anaerofilum sp. An201]OUP00474.1 sugar ABC transporter permease [Anaerofilum sp. An201]